MFKSITNIEVKRACWFVVCLSKQNYIVAFSADTNIMYNNIMSFKWHGRVATQPIRTFSNIFLIIMHWQWRYYDDITVVAMDWFQHTYIHISTRYLSQHIYRFWSSLKNRKSKSYQYVWRYVTDADKLGHEEILR